MRTKRYDSHDSTLNHILTEKSKNINDNCDKSTKKGVKTTNFILKWNQTKAGGRDGRATVIINNANGLFNNPLDVFLFRQKPQV
jgi:hypothetical protein